MNAYERVIQGKLVDTYSSLEQTVSVSELWERGNLFPSPLLHQEHECRPSKDLNITRN